jgi:hypothetical protein
MERIGKLFENLPKPIKAAASERGEIFDTILSRINPNRVRQGYKPLTHGRLAYLLTGIPTKDLYALVSKCDDAERRGFPWGAIFFKEITPNKTA